MAAVTPEKKRRGRPPLSEAEKARRAGTPSAPRRIKTKSTDGGIAAALAATAAPAASAPPLSLLERTMAALRPAVAAPSTGLPCREEERTKISSHLQSGVRRGGSSQVLYVSGMPGTGKTASVLEAVKQLRITRGAPPVTFLHVNAMRLGAPGVIFKEILDQLQPPSAGSRGSPVATAPDKLTALLESRGSKDPVVVLLIDEVDQLATQNQAVLYRIFNWLTLPNPRLVMVAISNTMNLPERMLPRVASRFTIVRVDFQPYKRDQIFHIVMERLKAHGVDSAFAPGALKLCSARVAASSGDIRKAFQLCRRAAELRLAAEDGEDVVQLGHLEAAQQDLLHSNPAAHYVRSLCPKARRFLIAFLLELRKRKGDSDSDGAVFLHRVTKRFARLLAHVDADDALSGGNHQPTVEEQNRSDQASYLADRLEAMSLLVVRRGPISTLALSSDADAEDLAGALEGVEENAGLLELLREGRR